jgi:hypothetical protein
MRKERKHYTGEEKVAILRRHLLDKVPVSDLCDERGLSSPSNTVQARGIYVSRFEIVETVTRMIERRDFES